MVFPMRSPFVRSMSIRNMAQEEEETGATPTLIGPYHKIYARFPKLPVPFGWRATKQSRPDTGYSTSVVDPQGLEWEVALLDVEDAKHVEAFLYRRSLSQTLMAVSRMHGLVSEDFPFADFTRLLPPPEGPVFASSVCQARRRMDTSMATVCKSPQQLTTEHYRYFAFQMLCGLHILHSCGAVHMNLSTRTVLVSEDCRIGLSEIHLPHCGRFAEDVDVFGGQRWYRAPELLLTGERGMVSPHLSTPANDIWSFGAIMCEIIGRKPMWAGRDTVSQISLVMKDRGAPEDCDCHMGRSARRFLLRFKEEKNSEIAADPKARLAERLPSIADENDLLDFLDKALDIDVTHPFVNGLVVDMQFVMDPVSHSSCLDTHTMTPDDRGVQSPQFRFEFSTTDDDQRALLWRAMLEDNPEMYEWWLEGE